MAFDHIPDISAWMAVAGIQELELTGPTSRLRLRLNDAGGGHVDAIVAIDDRDDLVEPIVSPSVGIFLHHHPMRAAPLMEEGAEIHAGQLIGLLQIGSLLLPVKAPKDGIVTSIMVPSGTVVGFGVNLVEFAPIEDERLMRGPDGN